MKYYLLLFVLLNSCVSNYKHEKLRNKLIDVEIKLGKCNDLNLENRKLRFIAQEKKYKLEGCQRRLMLCDKMYSNIKSQCYD